MGADTGDVQFVCLERKEDSEPELDSLESDTPLATPHSRRSSGSSSTATSFAPQTVARKRVIYAHSDILIRRSEYFATMLNSSFSETSTAPGGRKTHTIIVEEADFVTIYWLLKWVYANWLLFKEHDNPKAAIDGVGAGWSVKWLTAAKGQDEWAWATFSTRHPGGEPLDVADARSVASGESASGKKGKAPAGPNPLVRGSPSAGSTSSKASTASGANASTATTRPPPSPVRRTTSGSAASTSAAAAGLSLTVPAQSAPGASSPTAGRARKDSLVAHLPPALSPSSTSFPPAHYAGPVSPHASRGGQGRARAPAQHGHGHGQAQADPHAHPCAPPPPASALSMYQVAHRYGMPGLAALALEHMLATITPPGSFALLLASATWEELHKLVEVRLLLAVLVPPGSCACAGLCGGQVGRGGGVGRV